VPLDRFQSIDPALLDVQPTDNVIDLGCGTGRHVLELAKRRCNLIGADMSQHDLRIGRYLLEIMRRRGEVRARVHWLRTAGERLPFVDSAFDRVICTETLEHVDDDRVLMRELVRVLKPGGVLAVSVPDEWSEKLFWRLSHNYRSHAGGHVRVYERRGIVRLMRDAGLAPYAVRYRHALETVYWLSHVAFWSDWNAQGPITRRFRSALDSHRARESRIVTLLDDVGNRILPKSIVVYSRKPLEQRLSENGVPTPVITVADDTPHEFGTPEHMPPEIAPDAQTAVAEAPYRERVAANGVLEALAADEDDDRAEVEVRAVPAPFSVDPPPVAPDRTGALPLMDELRLSLKLTGDEQKRRLVEVLRSCRFALLREVQDLSGEQASTPWTEDGRTVKEVLGHISGWERWTAAALAEIRDGVREPQIMTLSGYPDGVSRYATIEAFNAARMGEARERPWSFVLEDSARVFDDLVAQAEQTPAESLAATAPFYWPDIGGTVPCGLYLLMVAAHHYQEEHLPEIARAR
jgi:SAM-dependent methyltransferase